MIFTYTKVKYGINYLILPLILRWSTSGFFCLCVCQCVCHLDVFKVYLLNHKTVAECSGNQHTTLPDPLFPIPDSPHSRGLPRFHSCELLLQYLRHPGPFKSLPGATHSHCAGTNLETLGNLATICGEQRGWLLLHRGRVTGASLRPTPLAPPTLNNV